MKRQLIIKLTERESEELIHGLCVDLEACEALNEGDAHRHHEDHRAANAILDKLIAAGATRENFQAWRRRRDEAIPRLHGSPFPVYTGEKKTKGTK